MSANTLMKIQIAMNQKKKTIMDAKMSLKVIALCTPSKVAPGPGPAACDGRSRDWRAHIARRPV
jgi:hypothetical protein